MRLSLPLLIVACLVGCGDNNNTSPADLSATAGDMATGGGGGADMMTITPYNNPGHIFCYGQLTCSAPMQVCCDERADGGFSDTCVASTGACSGTGARAYECGQAADCMGGKICCGTTGMSSSGKQFLASTTCEASCMSGQIQLCVSASECKTGTKCVGESISGRSIGVCM